MKNKIKLAGINLGGSQEKLFLPGINCGVPQGSSLGPLLLLIYINDLPFSLQNSQVTMYADDTTFSHSPITIVNFSENLNRDLCNLKQRLQGNKLSLNLTKTQAMVIGSRLNLKKIFDKKAQPPTFVIDDSQIEVVEKAKYLGVQFDQHLVLDEHVRYVCTKVSRALGLTIEVSLSHIFVTVAQCGGAVGKPGLLHCRSYRIVLPE